MATPATQRAADAVLAAVNGGDPDELVRNILSAEGDPSDPRAAGLAIGGHVTLGLLLLTLLVRETGRRPEELVREALSIG